MEHHSLDELRIDSEDKDLLLECTMIIRVDVSIERPHYYEQDKAGNVELKLDEGWLVSLALPPRDPGTVNTEPFTDGEPQMLCDLKYMSEEDDTVGLKDAIRALGIDTQARIWRVKPAP